VGGVAACAATLLGSETWREGILVSDYRVKISVSNARIRRAIEAAGYTSVLQMCRAKNLPIGATFDLVNMKASPLNQKGEWRKCVLQLCDAVYALPNDLFSERQKVIKLKTATGYKDVTEAELTSIASDHVWDDRLEDLRDNEGVREIAQEETEKLLKAALDASLTTKEKLVLSARYGLRGESHSLEEVGNALNVSKERVRQIENKALRKLRLRVSLHNEGKGSEIGKVLCDLNDNTDC
jgi:RNA polymerase sigma factor (sigma-70 family)